jgi:hypothetical protein
VAEPVKPIVLNEIGESLTLDRSATDDNLLSGGTHTCCGGEADVVPITPEYKVVHCKKCGLRIEVPANVRTYGDLRVFLEHLQP